MRGRPNRRRSCASTAITRTPASARAVRCWNGFPPAIRASRGGGASVNTLAGRRTLRRYSRHLLIPEVGLAGQERLASARVLVVGAGGLGAPVLAYLAAAGVGRIGVVDDDAVDETNLQRQIIYATADIGRSKVAVAAERIAALNPGVAVDVFPLRLKRTTRAICLRPYDVIVDATDSFESRYAVNDACRFEGKPDVFGSIFRFDGQVAVFGPSTACYRCLFPNRRRARWCRVVRRAACSACWPAWSAVGKPTKCSNCSWELGARSPAVCC